MNKWQTIPTNVILDQTVANLSANNMQAIIVENGQEAKKKVLELIPKGSQVQANTSKTLDAIGLVDAIDSTDGYQSVRKEIFSLDQKTDGDKIRTLRSVQDFAIGSVSAITEKGQLMIASNTGSQLAGEVFGAKKVIFVIGAQKIVSNLDEGQKRIFEYVLPLESARARKAYNLPDTWESYPSKILIYNREVMKDRVHVILVKEVLGF